MASTLIGTVLGGLLAILGGYLVGLKQRAWQKEQAMFDELTRLLGEGDPDTRFCRSSRYTDDTARR